MKLNSIEIRGFGPHTDTRIEFNEPITAIIGHNGAGKTFVLETIPAIFYGDFPSRSGSILDHITQGHYGDAMIACEFEIDDRVYRAERKARKTMKTASQECYLFKKEAGNWQAVAGPKQEDFRREITRLVGDEKIFFSSVFSSQNMAGDLIDAKPIDRKRVLCEMLGLERYQERSDYFSEKAKTAFGAILNFNQQRDMLKSQISEHSVDIQSKIYAFEKELILLNEDILKKDAESIKIRTDLSKVQGQKNEILKCSKRLDELKSQRVALVNKVLEFQKRILSLDQLATTIPEIEKYQAERAILSEQKDKNMDVFKFNTELNAKGLELQSEYHKLKAEIEILKNKKESAIKESKNTHISIMQKLEAELGESDRTLKSLNNETHILESGNFEFEQCKACKFTAKAFLAKKDMPELEAKISNSRKILIEMQKLELPTPEIVGQIDIQLVEKESRQKVLVEQMSQIKAQIKPIPEIIIPPDKSNELASAKAALSNRSEWMTLVDQNQAQIKDTDIEIEKIPATKPDEFTQLESKYQGDIKLIDAQKTQISFEIREKTIAIGGFKQAILKNSEIQTSIENLEKENESHLVDSKIFDYLKTAFGRNGIQALLIDSAIPGIQTISDDLLQIATEGRYSIQIATEKENKGGGTSESLEILCSDQAGTRDIQNFSGGEQKILRTVLRMALSIFQSNRSSVRLRTLFIDELFDALDQTNATALLQTLHRVSDHFDRVVFISHSDEILSDFGNRIELEKSSAGTIVRTA